MAVNASPTDAAALGATYQLSPARASDRLWSLARSERGAGFPTRVAGAGQQESHGVRPSIVVFRQPNPSAGHARCAERRRSFAEIHSRSARRRRSAARSGLPRQRPTIAIIAVPSETDFVPRLFYDLIAQGSSRGAAMSPDESLGDCPISRLKAVLNPLADS